jgi:hypothetical protein
MMSGGTFLLFKACSFAPESTKQAEIRLANLLRPMRSLMREPTCERRFLALSVGYG